MDFIMCDSYKELSRKCADEMLGLVQRKKDAKVILATGQSPFLAYRLFVEGVQKQSLDVSSVTWIKLDEWAHLPSQNKATCDYFIQKEILEPLHIQRERYVSIKAMEQNLTKECERMEQILSGLGQPDMAIVGVGRNGHIGLNEPGDFLEPGVHVAKLDAKTKQHAMLVENGESSVEAGITLGMRNIFSAERILILFSGEGKNEVYGALHDGKVTTRIPATLMQLHHNVRCYVDSLALMQEGEIR